ncbi:hypothetical protein BH10CHL1_BH10CHL1_23760 [soil metagenome]
MEQIGPLIRVQAVEPLEEFKVRVTFKNGVQKDLDLASYLHGPIFEPIKRDIVVFRSVKVVGSTIAWDNGASIDPDVLYYNLKPAWMEEILDEPRQQWPMNKDETVAEFKLAERH